MKVTRDGRRTLAPRRTGESDPGRRTRVALVHDWLVTWGGSESVLASLASLFPDAPIYTSVWNPEPRVRETFGGRDVRTTWLQRVPGAKRNHRRLLPFMPGAFRSLDLTDYDVVISDSHAFSKAVRVRPGAVHVCYCHTPPRYLWDLQSEYLNNGSRLLLRPAIRWLQKQDLRAARGVTRFLANSRYVADRIDRVYGRKAEVVYPPVDVERFGGRGRETRASESGGGAPARGGEGSQEPGNRGDSSRNGTYFLAGGRLVPYKRVDVAVRAATETNFPLRVFGDGPERALLERMAGPTVEFLGWLGPDELGRTIAGCRAFLFPGVEDFGILPVEVQAVGRPVVGVREGGLTESVVDGVTGVLYDGPGVPGLLAGIERMRETDFDEEAIRRHAGRFRRSSMERAVEEVLSPYMTQAPGG